MVALDGAGPPDEAAIGRLEIDGRDYVVVRAGPLADPTALDRLTPRELEIALLVAEGRDAKDIARRLRISFHTVRVHLVRAYGKLGLHKQTELVACVAARYGAPPRRPG
ncbi:MAG: helix-turn-helix transcriptional regulator [Acetobacteraceae bacterium]|nr:helix-turn-helix transcriptional regulator [Acetobacteraceae bacterium]